MSSSRRPIGVWVVCAYFAVSIAGTLISLLQLLDGEMSLTPAQQAYFDNLGPVDYIGARHDAVR